MKELTEQRVSKIVRGFLLKTAQPPEEDLFAFGGEEEEEVPGGEEVFEDDLALDVDEEEEEISHYDKVVAGIEDALNRFGDFLRDRVLKDDFRHAFLSDEGYNIVSQTKVGLGFLERLELAVSELNELKDVELPRVIDTVKNNK